MRPFAHFRGLALACGLALGLALNLGMATTAGADASTAPPPSATPATDDGVIQVIGIPSSRLGSNSDQITFLPTGAAQPVVLTVDRLADKAALDLGARPGDRIWLTVDNPLNPQHVVQITRIARPVPVLQKLIALGGALAVIAAFAALATAGRPWMYLVGDDNRMSNSQTQLVLWFGVVAVQKSGGAPAAVPAAPADPAAPAVAPATAVKPKFTDLVLNDFGAADLGDFQMILISTAATVIFACSCWEFLTLIDVAKATTLPDVDTALLGSFGIGQGAYLIKKAALPNGAG